VLRGIAGSGSACEGELRRAWETEARAQGFRQNIGMR